MDVSSTALPEMCYIHHQHSANESQQCKAETTDLTSLEMTTNNIMGILSYTNRGPIMWTQTAFTYKHWPKQNFH